MQSIITSIGIANPTHKVKQYDIYEFMAAAHQLNDKDASRLKKIYEHSGINFRHSVISDFGKENGTYKFFPNTKDLEPFPSTALRAELYKTHAIEIALLAIEKCLQNKKDFNAKDITHLITVSCTGMYAPGIDIEIVERMNLAKEVERTCINFMGCYGAMNALKIADYICRADENAKVLILDIELCTLHFQKENTLDNWIANSLFADGAAAVLIESLTTSTKGFILEKFHSTLITEAKDHMAWNIGDHGFEMRLSTQIAKNIKSAISNIAENLIHRTNYKLDEIERFAIHPGGRRILEVCEEEFKRDAEMNRYSYEVLRNYGNMSSVTILFVLHYLWNDLYPEDQGQPLAAFAFGPGLTCESMLLNINS